MQGVTPRFDDILTTYRRAPDRTAFFEEDGRAFTVGEFDAMVAAAEAWMRAQGIQEGDRIAVWLVNRIEWLALLFALARIGAVLVAVNTRYRSAELHHILSASGARMLVMQPDFHRIDFAQVIAGLDAGDLTELESVAVLGEPAAGRILDRPVLRLDLSAGDERPAPDTTSDPDAPAIFFTTSGTTKSPKLVMHPQRTLALHALRSAAAYGFDAEGASFLSAMPFCGVFGLNTVLAAIAGGAPVHIVPMFEEEDAARRIARHDITHLFGSDEMFRRLAQGHLKEIASARICGFASFTPGLGPALTEAAEKGVPLCGLYGSSEVNAIFSIQPLTLSLEERLKGGGMPASGAEGEVRVRDKESGRLLGPGETGELEIRAPTSFIGYYRNDKATAEAIDGEGFFRTGDVGHIRGDGSFVYVARSGDAIRLSGFLVDPAEIEDALKSLDSVADAQVVGVEEVGRTRPVAFVIAADATTFDEAAIVKEARGMLAAFKVPERIFPVNTFPATESANGLKIQKAKLRQMAAERLAAAERA